MTACTLAPGEDRQAHQAARERWIDCLEPNDEVSLAIADRSFRSKTRMDNVTRADESAAALRVYDTIVDYRQRRDQEVEELTEVFRLDSKQGRRKLLEIPEGCEMLLELLEKSSEAARLDLWGAVQSKCLLAMEGRGFDEHDPLLEMAVRVFDARRSLKNTIYSAERAGVGGESIRISAEMELEQTEHDNEVAREGIKQRIENLRFRIMENHLRTSAESEQMLQWLCDIAKVDTSDDGRLRHRYINEAQRDWLKITLEARADRDARRAQERARLLAGSEPTKPAQTPSERPRSTRAGAQASRSRNEPITGRNTSDERNGCPEPTQVVEPLGDSPPDV